MKHPAYHLRPNKAVDRIAMVEAIRRLERLVDLKDYTYYGLGGPYLEEYRLLYEYYPEKKYVSLEKDFETYKRQQFHKPCKILDLKNLDVGSFLTEWQPNDKSVIFWLDYPDLEYPNFAEFITLLGMIPEKSMVKITLRCEPTDYFNKADEFRNKFQSVMPEGSEDPPATISEFAYFLQRMLQISAEQALPASVTPCVFQPVASFYFADGVGIFTLTGLVWPRTELPNLKKIFKNWRLQNLDWSYPKKIDVPILSTKERLRLECRLPCKSKTPGKTLRIALGYLIDEDIASTESKLDQYAHYHRQFPYFMRAVP